MVCEPIDQWTKLIRRYSANGGFSVVRWTNLASAERDVIRGRGCVVAVSLTRQNAMEAMRRIAELSDFGGQHRFVGLCDAVLKEAESVFLSAGISACFFSLVDVQSLVRLAEVHFELVSKHVGFLSNELPTSTVDRILQELPKF